MLRSTNHIEYQHRVPSKHIARANGAQTSSEPSKQLAKPNFSSFPSSYHTQRQRHDSPIHATPIVTPRPPSNRNHLPINPLFQAEHFRWMNNKPPSSSTLSSPPPPTPKHIRHFPRSDIENRHLASVCCDWEPDAPCSRCLRSSSSSTTTNNTASKPPPTIRIVPNDRHLAKQFPTSHEVPLKCRWKARFVATVVCFGCGRDPCTPRRCGLDSCSHVHSSVLVVRYAM